MRILEEKNELQKKVHRRICMRDINFLAARPPFLCHFLLLFSSTPILRGKIKFTPENGSGETGATYLPVPTALTIKTEHLENIYGETHVW